MSLSSVGVYACPVDQGSEFDAESGVVVRILLGVRPSGSRPRRRREGTSSAAGGRESGGGAVLSASRAHDRAQG